MNTCKKTTLKELVQKGQVFAPCIWDCFSVKAAKTTGFQAALLSGGALANSCGFPDIALITADDLVYATEHICGYTDMPIIVDADDGYGETPLNAYRTTDRLVKAGAMALTLDDTTGVRGWERWGDQMIARKREGTIDHPVIQRNEWLAKVKAALEACAGTNCLLIARTECKLQYGLDEAIERCIRARELGAEMTLIIGLKTQEEAEKVAKYVPGWKMWPDVMSKNGTPDIELDKIAPLGFNLVTTHYLELAAMTGMLDFGKHVLADKSTVYPDSFAQPGNSIAASMNCEKWFDLEGRCYDLKK